MRQNISPCSSTSSHGLGINLGSFGECRALVLVLVTLVTVTQFLIISQNLDVFLEQDKHGGVLAITSGENVDSSTANHSSAHEYKSKTPADPVSKILDEMRARTETVPSLAKLLAMDVPQLQTVRDLLSKEIGLWTDASETMKGIDELDHKEVHFLLTSRSRPLNQASVSSQKSSSAAMNACRKKDAECKSSTECKRGAQPSKNMVNARRCQVSESKCASWAQKCAAASKAATAGEAVRGRMAAVAEQSGGKEDKKAKVSLGGRRAMEEALQQHRRDLDAAAADTRALQAALAQVEKLLAETVEGRVWDSFHQEWETEVAPDGSRSRRSRGVTEEVLIPELTARSSLQQQVLELQNAAHLAAMLNRTLCLPPFLAAPRLPPAADPPWPAADPASPSGIAEATTEDSSTAQIVYEPSPGSTTNAADTDPDQHLVAVSFDRVFDRRKLSEVVPIASAEDCAHACSSPHASRHIWNFDARRRVTLAAGLPHTPPLFHSNLLFHTAPAPASRQVRRHSRRVLQESVEEGQGEGEGEVKEEAEAAEEQDREVGEDEREEEEEQDETYKDLGGKETAQEQAEEESGEEQGETDAPTQAKVSSISGWQRWRSHEMRRNMKPFGATCAHAVHLFPAFAVVEEAAQAVSRDPKALGRHWQAAAHARAVALAAVDQLYGSRRFLAVHWPCLAPAPARAVPEVGRGGFAFWAFKPRGNSPAPGSNILMGDPSLMHTWIRKLDAAAVFRAVAEAVEAHKVSWVHLISDCPLGLVHEPMGAFLASEQRRAAVSSAGSCGLIAEYGDRLRKRGVPPLEVQAEMQAIDMAIAGRAAAFMGTSGSRWTAAVWQLRVLAITKSGSPGKVARYGIANNTMLDELACAKDLRCHTQEQSLLARFEKAA